MDWGRVTYPPPRPPFDQQEPQRSLVSNCPVLDLFDDHQHGDANISSIYQRSL